MDPLPKRRDDTLQTLTAPLTPSPHAHESRRTGRCWRRLSTPQQKPDTELLELLSKGLSAGIPSCMRNTRHSDATAMPQSRMRWSPVVAQPKPAAVARPASLFALAPRHPSLQDISSPYPATAKVSTKRTIRPSCPSPR